MSYTIQKNDRDYYRIMLTNGIPYMNFDTGAPMLFGSYEAAKHIAEEYINQHDNYSGPWEDVTE